MTKGKANQSPQSKSFSGHKFDTSNYVVLNLGVYRDSKTGQLAQKAASSTKEVKAKK
jgi:hypothetical protein